MPFGQKRMSEGFAKEGGVVWGTPDFWSHFGVYILNLVALVSVAPVREFDCKENTLTKQWGPSVVGSRCKALTLAATRRTESETTSPSKEEKLDSVTVARERHHIVVYTTAVRFRCQKKEKRLPIVDIPETSHHDKEHPPQQLRIG